MNGILFDSKAEVERYIGLMHLLRKGQISQLRLQPTFVLQEAYTTPMNSRTAAGAADSFTSS